MLKRRDWLHMRGEDGGDSSDESSDDGDHAGSPEDASNTSSEGSSSGSEDLGPGVRLQDLSEDDMDGSDISSGEIGGGAAGGAESAETYPALDSLLQDWLDSSVAQHVKGPPLRCPLCTQALLLNAPALVAHLTSKKHAKQLAAAGGTDPADSIDHLCFARDCIPEEAEAVETHTERLDRLRQASSKRQQREYKNQQLKLKRSARKRTRASRQDKQELKRPGKRQRAQLKLEVFGQAANISANSLAGKAPEAQALPDNKGKPPAAAKATQPAGSGRQPAGKLKRPGGKGREPGGEKAAGKSRLPAGKRKSPPSKQQSSPPAPGQTAAQPGSGLKKTVKLSKKKRLKHKSS